MAAYDQSITVAALDSNTEAFNDVNDKIQLTGLFTLLVAEFAAAETAGLGSYTVTTGLQASLERTLDNVSNNLRVENFVRWITYLVTEFDSVETLGLSYVVTTSATIALQELLDLLNQSIANTPCSEVRISFHLINALLNTEFGLMAAAS
jgi:hypothetical protein